MKNILYSSRLGWLAIVAALMLTLFGPIGATAQDTESTPDSGESEISSQLPAADLPSMNEQGFVFEIESTWDGSFDSVPTEAPVYSMTMPTYDEESFTAFAENMGISGEVSDLGDGSWETSGDEGSLYAAPGFAQFISNAEIPEGELPNDEQAVAYAREWLRQTGTLPADAGDGIVMERVEDPPRIFVVIKPVRPENLMSAYPNIVVTMGPNAQVIEASFRWYDLAVTDTYALLPATTAWQEVEERRSFLQADIPADIAEPGSTVRGRAVFTSLTVSYTTSGIVGEEQYLQPVYVFEGTIQVEGSDGTYAVRAFVPALINSQQPVG